MRGRREVDGFRTVRGHSAGCWLLRGKLLNPCMRTHGDGGEAGVQQVMSW